MYSFIYETSQEWCINDMRHHPYITTLVLSDMKQRGWCMSRVTRMYAMRHHKSDVFIHVCNITKVMCNSYVTSLLHHPRCQHRWQYPWHNTLRNTHIDDLRGADERAHDWFNIHTDLPPLQAAPFRVGRISQKVSSTVILHSPEEQAAFVRNFTTIVTVHRRRRNTSPSFSVLQCVAVCCSALQCVAVCCSVLQCAAVCCRWYAEVRHIALF